MLCIYVTYPKKIKKFAKKGLTFEEKGDIIYKPSEMRARKLKKSQKSSKNFEKSFENLLTNSRECDIINKLSKRKSLLEGSTRKFKKTLKKV